jgi:aminoglycoside phosphotransferase (APT) family kinase protein
MADSTTKVPVTDAELAAMVRRAFGDDAVVRERVELTDGYYNMTYRIHLADGRVSVLKVAPPPGMKLLTHEVDLMRTEVDFYLRAAAVGAPVPAVLYAGLERDLIGRDYLFLELLDGESLERAAPQLSTVDKDALHRQLGTAIGRLHTATGDAFGYPLRDSRTWRPTWREAFLAMVDDILDDAVRLGTELPGPPDVIRARMARHAPLLDAVRRPALVHFDLWDGNVFVAPGPNGWRLTGMIDGERALFGDPYAEFISIAIFRDIRELPSVLDGYAEITGERVEFTEDVRIRIALYTCYLYLLIVTEGPTRGYDPVVHDPDRLRTLRLLTEQLNTL